MNTYTKTKYDKGLITEVVIIPVESKKYPQLRAKVNFTIANAFKGYLGYVVNGPNGLFPTFQQKKEFNGNFREVFHPLTKDARIEFHDKVLNAYEKAISPQLSLL